MTVLVALAYWETDDEYDARPYLVTYNRNPHPTSIMIKPLLIILAIYIPIVTCSIVCTLKGNNLQKL